jgi:hypothetical protein
MSNNDRQSLHKSVEGAATDYELNKEMAIEERRRRGSRQTS